MKGEIEWKVDVLCEFPKFPAGHFSHHNTMHKNLYMEFLSAVWNYYRGVCQVTRMCLRNQD